MGCATLGGGFHTSYFSITTAAPWSWEALQSESCLPTLCWWMGWQHRGEGRVCESGASQGQVQGRAVGKARGKSEGQGESQGQVKGQVRGTLAPKP